MVQRSSRRLPPVTICVLTYGSYLHLARRCLESIRRHCDRSLYRLVVGANAVGPRTHAYLRSLRRAGWVDELILSRHNLNKCPMMRRMVAHVETEFVWWFDDDSYVERPRALEYWLRSARRSASGTVMWGQAAFVESPRSFLEVRRAAEFVRTSSWYRGLTPPAWEPGGKGDFDFEGRGTGDGRWFFITGGCWLIRTRAIRALDWPDRRLVKEGDDVLLGEAIRQQGWDFCNTGANGVILDRAQRRGAKGQPRFSGRHRSLRTRRPRG
jgi:GT2 family glycosyltransferase